MVNQREIEASYTAQRRCKMVREYDSYSIFPIDMSIFSIYLITCNYFRPSIAEKMNEVYKERPANFFNEKVSNVNAD